MTGERPYFFIHVMKTGGTSFKSHLLQHFELDEIYPSARLDWRRQADVDSYVSVPRLLGISPDRRGGIRVYSGHVPYVVTELMGGRFVTLTLLRDPVERTVSVLKHFKRLHHRYREFSLRETYDDPVVFRHFVENHQAKVFSLTAEDQLGSFASALGYEELHAALGDSSVDIFGYDPDTPRSAGLDPESRREARARATAPEATIEVDAERLVRAKENLAKVDVVGFADRYAEFVEELRRRFGWWPEGLDLDVRENVSSESWSAGEGLRRRIAADNTADLELYAYAQDLVARRRRESPE